MVESVFDRIEAALEGEGLKMDDVIKGYSVRFYVNALTTSIERYNAGLTSAVTADTAVRKLYSGMSLRDTGAQLQHMTDRLCAEGIFTPAQIDKVKALMAPTLTQEQQMKVELAKVHLFIVANGGGTVGR